MGTILQDGVRLRCYPLDHLPVHVHCLTGGVRIILELLNGEVTIADREDALPVNAKASDIKRAIKAAERRYDDILILWGEMHAKS